MCFKLCLCLTLFLFSHVFSLSLRKDPVVVSPNVVSSVNDDCDPSTVPVMSSFDLKKFSGNWYELAKSASGYIDVNDGMWKISSSNTSGIFLFSGRDYNRHCIRPIKGKILPSHDMPGLLHLRYQTYSTHVEETIRILFTDYTSVAVVYNCMHHVHQEKEVCHSAGLFGAIWTRQQHVDVSIFEKAASYLEMACVHKSILRIRNIVGPCIVDTMESRVDDFPAPDFCYQPVDLGSCRGSLQRYFYDPKDRICKIFTYGGCGGNRNNFMSLPECQEKCASVSFKEPVCMSIAKCGLHCSPCCTEDRIGCVQCNCEHIIEDHFLDCVKSPSYCQPECEAEEFYPGCHVCRCDEEYKTHEGNGACLEVKSVGTCSENVQRYYYDDMTNKCKEFIYSGCSGNNNNFQSLQECKEKCQVPDYITQQASEPDSSNSLSSMYVLITTSLILLFQKLQSSSNHF